GGVMTDEVGVVTGELTLRTERFPDGEVVVRVQYRDAAEWYTVTGGRTRLVDPADPDAVHAVAGGLLDRPHGRHRPPAPPPPAAPDPPPAAGVGRRAQAGRPQPRSDRRRAPPPTA